MVDQADKQDEIAPPRKRHCLLAVDDSKSNNQLVVGIFEDEPSIQVITAESGAEALRAIEQRPYDLVLLDVGLRDMSDLEVCRRIKSLPNCLRDIPVLMVTARTESETKLEGFRVGAEDYITKPFHPEELIARVRVHLRLRDLQEEIIQGERLHTLISTVSSVHHEINNPLTTILGNAEILERKLTGTDSDETDLKRIRRIIAAVERIQSVIQRLREAKQVIETEYVRSKRMIDIDKI